MTIEYFGYATTSTGTQSPSGAGFDINNTYVFTSPGTTGDTYRIDSLQMYTKVSSGSSSLRLALYDSDLNLVCQGSEIITVTNTSSQWLAHTASTIQPAGGNAGDTAYIAGGTNFKICITKNGPIFFYTAVLNFTDSWKYNTTDYTGGFPGSVTIPDSNDYTTTSWAVRVGVELQVATGHPASKRLGGVPFASQPMQSQCRW